MNIHQQVQEALAAFALPISETVYEYGKQGWERSFFTYNYSTLPTAFSDNAPKQERYLLQVHYCCPSSENSRAIRRSIKKALHRVGFSWPSEVNASDKQGQHFVFECEHLEGVVIDGDV